MAWIHRLIPDFNTCDWIDSPIVFRISRSNYELIVYQSDERRELICHHIQNCLSFWVRYIIIDWIFSYLSDGDILIDQVENSKKWRLIFYLENKLEAASYHGTIIKHELDDQILLLYSERWRACERIGSLIHCTKTGQKFIELRNDSIAIRIWCQNVISIRWAHIHLLGW